MTSIRRRNSVHRRIYYILFFFTLLNFEGIGCYYDGDHTVEAAAVAAADGGAVSDRDLFDDGGPPGSSPNAECPLISTTAELAA